VHCQNCRTFRDRTKKNPLKLEINDSASDFSDRFLKRCYTLIIVLLSTLFPYGVENTLFLCWYAVKYLPSR